MLSSVETNVASGQRFRNLIRQRDIFFHDGKALRRLTLAPGAQIGAAIALFGLLLWSIFAAFQLSTENEAQRDAQLAQQVEAMEADLIALKKVAQERYSYTAQEVRKLGLNPARFDGQGGPFEAVEPLKAANPDFKQLFMSWKKLDQIEEALFNDTDADRARRIEATAAMSWEARVSEIVDVVEHRIQQKERNDL